MLFTHVQALTGQVNRIRCGQLGGQPVVVAVDAAGGVLVAPSLMSSRLPPVKLLNPGFGQQGVSTWGIGLPKHMEGGERQGKKHMEGGLEAWFQGVSRCFKHLGALFRLVFECF